MYETLVEQGDNTVQGFVAYCLYKHGKREWIQKFEADNNRVPTPEELKAYVSTYTSQPIAAVQAQAAGILAEFADSAVNDARAGIVEETLKGSTAKSIRDSITANAIYTLVLVVLVVVLKYAGVDILGILNSA